MIFLLTLLLLCGCSRQSTPVIKLDGNEYVPAAMIEVSHYGGHAIYTPAYIRREDFIGLEDKTRSELARIMWMAENDSYMLKQSK